MAWKLLTSPVAKKFKSQPSASKIMLTLFWGRDMEGEILVQFTPNGETVNSQNYCDVLVTKLKPEIRPKRREKLLKDVILLHEKARPHTVNQTVETINELGFELMEHPPYSTDLAPSDFHMFGPMKEALRGRTFSSDEETSHWRGAKSVKDATLFLTEFKKKILKRWNRCVEFEWGYVEK
jgi:histone-lysine N-methyltransferase SETMAR